jgi:hypothetical protein
VEQNAKKITILFLSVQLMLYAAFLAIDITGGSVALSSYLKFTIIILCFCYALFLGKSADRSILFCMKTALFFTLVSDLFILILDYYYYGVLTFIFAQQLYGIRIMMEQYNVEIEEEQKQLRRSFLLQLAVQAAIMVLICVILIRTGTELDDLLISSVFYFISIVTNALRGIKSAACNPKKREMVLFAVGITLFLLCDINVGLFNLSGYISLPKGVYTVIYSMSSILMWTFYAPSQVLISLSTRQGKVPAEQQN